MIVERPWFFNNFAGAMVDVLIERRDVDDDVAPGCWLRRKSISPVTCRGITTLGLHLQITNSSVQFVFNPFLNTLRLEKTACYCRFRNTVTIIGHSTFSPGQ